jgi:hypothetical protein
MEDKLSLIGQHCLVNCVLIFASIRPPNNSYDQRNAFAAVSSIRGTPEATPSTPAMFPCPFRAGRGLSNGEEHFQPFAFPTKVLLARNMQPCFQAWSRNRFLESKGSRWRERVRGYRARPDFSGLGMGFTVLRLVFPGCVFRCHWQTIRSLASTPSLPWRPTSIFISPAP